MKDIFDLKYGSTKSFENRVVKNGWPATVFGRALGFCDIGVLEVAAIEKRVDPYGAVLVLAEEEAGDLRFGTLESFEREPSAAQQETLEQIAAQEGDSLPRMLQNKAESELPAIFTAEFAITKNCLYFREGLRRDTYDRVLHHWEEQLPAHEDAVHRHFHAGLRSHLQDIGYGLSKLPQVQLDDQERMDMRSKTMPDINELYCNAQTLQRVSLPTPHFAIVAARHAFRASTL